MAQRTVLAVTGTGGVAIAVARRLGSGRIIALGSRSEPNLKTTKEALELEGHDVRTFRADMLDQGSIEDFAKGAAALGPVEVVVHTSGISPSQTGSVDAILKTNLHGTALVIDAFEKVIAPGGSLVVVSSMAAYMMYLLPPLPEELQKVLATAPVSDFVQDQQYKTSCQNITEKGHAYCVSKYANNIRVEGKATAYGRKGARINSVSPGLIMTRMGHNELGGPSGEQMKKSFQGCPLDRAATPDDVASSIAFLAGRESSYMTGSDLRLDGGVTAGGRWIKARFPDRSAGGEK